MNDDVEGLLRNLNKIFPKVLNELSVGRSIVHHMWHFHNYFLPQSKELLQKHVCQLRRIVFASRFQLKTIRKHGREDIWNEWLHSVSCRCLLAVGLCSRLIC